jgi:hypothetical protein
MELDRRGGYFIQDRFKNDRGGRPRERLPPRRHLVQHHAERKQVGAVVQSFSACLLGRHIGNRPHRSSRRGELVHADGSARRSCRPLNHSIVLRSEFRQAKIKNLGLAALGDKNIRRLYVAVHNAAGVGSSASAIWIPMSSNCSSLSGRPSILCLRVVPSRYSIAMKACPSSSPMS